MTVEYQVVEASTANSLNSQLNTLATRRWRLHSWHTRGRSGAGTTAEPSVWCAIMERDCRKPLNPPHAPKRSAKGR